MRLGRHPGKQAPARWVLVGDDAAQLEPQAFRPALGHTLTTEIGIVSTEAACRPGPVSAPQTTASSQFRVAGRAAAPRASLLTGPSQVEVVGCLGIVDRRHEAVVQRQQQRCQI